MVQFKDAVLEQTTLRLALIGPSGSGKTYTALSIACRMAERLGTRVAVIDSEAGSARKYARRFKFGHLVLDTYEPERYVEAIDSAIVQGFGVVVVDSASHAWAGKGGILEFVDKEKRRSEKSDGYNAWGKATPKQNAFVDRLIKCEGKVHLIVTLRSKMEYIKEDDPSRPGKTRIRKVGLQPIQRDGMEYEFDLIGELDQSNNMVITKTRCDAVENGAEFERPGAAFADTLLDWTQAGEPIAAAKVEAPPTETKPMAKAATTGPKLVPEPAPEPAAEASSEYVDDDVFGENERPFEDVDASETPAKPVECITPSQADQLMRTARSSGLKLAQLKALVKDIAGIESSRDIPVAKLPALLEAIKRVA